VVPRAVYFTVGYSLLFLIFGVLWLWVFFRGAFAGRKALYLPAISTGALAFTGALLLQTPVQIYANTLLTTWGASLLLTGAVTVLISGLVQEAFRMLAIWLNRFINGERLGWLPLGLAVGFGFGVWEAWRLVAIPFGKNGVWMPLAVFERLSAIGLHLALGFIVAYGWLKAQPGRYFLLAALLHAAANFWAMLYLGRIIGIWPTEIAIFAVSLLSLFLAARLYHRESNRV